MVVHEVSLEPDVAGGNFEEFESSFGCCCLFDTQAKVLLAPRPTH